MTETRAKKAPVVERDEADSERALGRVVSLGLPLASVLGAVLVGGVAEVGSGLLVIAAGALLGTIALLWASVRTLSGDAPLGTGFEALAAQRHGIDALGQEKQRLLRALKDLESERELGKIDEGDYEAVVDVYRADAKRVMRQMDSELAPKRAEAEAIAKEFLAKRARARDEAALPDHHASGPALEDDARRRACPRCETSNEPDADFCKKCGASLGSEGESADATR
jgi:hypothetical protein